jgi:hypothetical protein
LRRPPFQAEGQPRRLLQGKITGRPRVRMAKTEQEINVGGPWTDAMQRYERCMRRIGVHVSQRVDIDLAFAQRFADCLERPDLGPRQSDARKLFGTGAPYRLGIERIECRGKASPDRCCACGRELLRADDRAQARKAGWAPAQRRPAGNLDQPAQACVRFGDARQAKIEVVFVAEKACRHGRLARSKTACAKARGLSCGGLCPTFSRTRRS